MKTCQVEKELLVQNQIIQLKMKKKLITTRPKLILNPLKIKHLWNQIQIQRQVHNQIHGKSKILSTLNNLLSKHKIHR